MSNTRRWALVGALAAVSGLGAGSIAVAGGSPAINLKDAATIEPVAGSNQPFGPVSAAGSSSDSPGYPGWVDRSPESADSPAGSAADSPAASQQRRAAADSPARVRQPAASNSADSADSPAPVRKVRKAPTADSADSPAWGGGSGGSAGSAD
jgi:hypothetical protein